MEDELDEIKKLRNGRTQQVWNIRDKVMGGKKKRIEASAILNPITGKLVVSKKEIKDVSLKYCKDTLANNAPEKNYEKCIEDKKAQVKHLMELSNGNFNPNIGTFMKNVKKFKSKGKKSYDFLTKAGSNFQYCMFKFCERMLNEEKFPNQLHDTMLHMIYKGKGAREVLSNNRFIHC